jgi:hypothetical protein
MTIRFPLPAVDGAAAVGTSTPLLCLPILWEVAILASRANRCIRCITPTLGRRTDALVVAAYDGERGPVRPQLAWPIRSAIGTDSESPFGPDHDAERLRGAKVVPDDRLWSHQTASGGFAPNDQWFAVYCDRYAPNPFISQRWDKVMHLVSDPETQADAPGGCFRRFFQGVCFKGGFTSVCLVSVALRNAIGR